MRTFDSSPRAAVLEHHFASPETALRPIFTSLNGDTSWLMSFPRPVAERKSSGKAYFHIVTDPWLSGGTFAIHPWMMSIDATIPAAVQSGDAVELLVREIEEAAAAAGIVRSSKPAQDDNLGVDAIFISIYLPDHLHEPTLRSFDKRTPVVTSLETAKIINQWGYFNSVTTTGDLDPAAAQDWPSLHPGGPLPSWLTAFRLNGHHEYNFAFMIVWTSSGGDAPSHEVVMYSPHGIKDDQPAAKAFAELCRQETPRISVLAIMHGLKESFTAGGRNTLGVAAGLAMESALQPRYWVKSHDAVVKYTGLIGRLTRDYARTLMDGLNLQGSNEKARGDNAHDDEDRTTDFVEIQNGESFVLE